MQKLTLFTLAAVTTLGATPLAGASCNVSDLLAQYQNANSNCIVIEQECTDKDALIKEILEGVYGNCNSPSPAPTNAPVPTKAPTVTPAPTTVPTATPAPTKVPTVTPSPTAVPTSAPSEEDASLAQQVVKLVNEERAKEGLSELKIDAKLESAALVRAKETVTQFSHTRPNGQSFSTAITEAGASYRGSGENIAWGQKTAKEVMDGWMNSSGHRANIMNKNYTSIGVGTYINNGRIYWVQLFTY